jgi:very-short-patch-repair endonuclease
VPPGRRNQSRRAGSQQIGNPRRSRLSTCPNSIHIDGNTGPWTAKVDEHRSMPMFDPAVHRVMAAHGGVISRAQLLELDLSSSAIGRRVSSGELRPVFPGVYRHASTTLSPEVRLRALALRLGPEAVIAGRWAAWWHGLAKVACGPICVIVPPNRWPPRLVNVEVSRRALDPADLTVVRRLRVTGRARTVIDCAVLDDAEDIRDAALQRGTSIWSLDRALERLGTGRGVAGARRLVDGARGGGESHPERALLRALHARGEEAWVAAVRVRVGPGEDFWVDLAIEDIRLGIEVDGWTVHSQAEKYHSDRGRQNTLIISGWTILRYTPRHIRDDLDGVVDEILGFAATLRRDRTRSAGRAEARG